MCAEEDKLKEENPNTSLLVSKPLKRYKGKKSKFFASTSASAAVQGYPRQPTRFNVVGAAKIPFKKELKCFFCKKKGHKKHECIKYKA